MEHLHTTLRLLVGIFSTAVFCFVPLLFAFWVLNLLFGS